MSDDSTPKPLSQVDLSDLRLMPSWVANFGTQTSHANIEDDEAPRERRGRDRDRGDSRGAGGGGGRRFEGERRESRGPRPGGDRPRGDRPPGKFGRRDDRQAPRVFDDRPQMPSGLKVTVEAEDKALDALAQHVKNLGRAFSVFDAARLVLAGAERHRVKVECEAERLVGLFQVKSDGSLFETKEEAVRYVLRNPEATADYYQVEEIEVEEPKGVFNSVAVCGMSGEILGPTSHHSYQTALKRVHTERFANVPFDDYKRRVKIDSTPEQIEKWKEQQRKATRWTWLKGEVAEGAEPVSFTSRAEFEAHFRRQHAEDVVNEVREGVVHGTAKREQLSPGLGRLLRRHIEDAKKHLFEVSQKIAHGLERRGLKLFKRRAGKMFVSRVKPRAIDAGTVFSPRINSIVECIKADAGMLLPKLLETLAPSAAATAEGEVKQLTEEQKGVLLDLHWLADEGYVIIYSDDVLFLGVQGEPPHHTPEAKAAAAAAAAAAESESSSSEPASEEATASAEAAPAHHADHELPSDEEEQAAAETAEGSASDPSSAD